jgi:hypothetical protein
MEANCNLEERLAFVKKEVLINTIGEKARLS